MSETTLLVCINSRLAGDKPSCAGRGSEQLADALEQALVERGLAVALGRIKCFGRCHEGPNVRLAPGGRFWRGAGLRDVTAIIDHVAAKINGG